METRSKRVPATVKPVEEKPDPVKKLIKKKIAAAAAITSGDSAIVMEEDHFEDVDVEDSESDLGEEVQDLVEDVIYNDFIQAVVAKKGVELDEKSVEDDTDFQPPENVSAKDENQEISSESSDDSEDEDHEDSEKVEVDDIGAPVGDVKVPRIMRKEADARFPLLWRTHYQLSHYEASSYKSEEDPNFEPPASEVEDDFISCDDCEEGDEGIAGEKQHEHDDDCEEDENLLKMEEDELVAGLIADLALVEVKDEEEEEVGGDHQELMQVKPPLGQVFSDIDETGYNSAEDLDYKPSKPEKLNAEDSDSSTDLEHEIEDNNEESDNNEKVEDMEQ